MTILCMNEIAWLAQHSSWPAADHQTLIAVAWAESKGNTEAIGTNKSVLDSASPGGWTPLSASHDLGLLQINNYWYAAKYMVGKGLDWRDPADNLELARYAWLEGKTWTKWTTFKAGLHVPFMPGAATALRAPLRPPSTPEETAAAATKILVERLSVLDEKLGADNALTRQRVAQLSAHLGLTT